MLQSPGSHLQEEEVAESGVSAGELQTHTQSHSLARPIASFSDLVFSDALHSVLTALALAAFQMAN